MQEIVIITVVFAKVQTLHITYFESKKKKKNTGKEMWPLIAKFVAPWSLYAMSTEH